MGFLLGRKSHEGKGRLALMQEAILFFCQSLPEKVRKHAKFVHIEDINL